jgi:hypothetical protein
MYSEGYCTLLLPQTSGAAEWLMFSDMVQTGCSMNCCIVTALSLQILLLTSQAACVLSN